MLVVGTRPNFMKAAPIMEAIAAENRNGADIDAFLVHTGQHYDYEMSQVFFEELELPKPNAYLGVGSGSHAEQTAKVMLAIEPIIMEYEPDVVVVVGDVNSTLAAALTAAKLGIKVAHVEAGVRSFDRSMPEEINRVATDAISDLLFPPCQEGYDNLIREGKSPDQVFMVGDTMIDTLMKYRDKAIARETYKRFGVGRKGYVLFTIHRPSNVDDPETLSEIISAIGEIQEKFPVIFPIHPRTKKGLRNLVCGRN